MEALDKYIRVKVLVPGEDGEYMVFAKVQGKKRDKEGNLVGSYNANPMLNSHVYKLKMPDGHVAEYTTNQIAESLYSQVDEDGYETGILDEITDHRRGEEAVSCDDGFTKTIQGVQWPVITTKGWDIQVRCHWSMRATPLSIECAEYAISQGIGHEPAFNWWKHKVMKKHDHTIAKVVARCRKKAMKF